MSRVRPADEQAPDNDAFLDVVANLVGILVILIMVIGVRTEGAWRESQKQSISKPNGPPDAEQAQATHTLNQTKHTYENVLADIRQLDFNKSVVHDAVLRQRAQRDRLQVLVTAVQRQLDQRRQSLDQAQRQRIDQQQNRDRLIAELESTRASIQALDRAHEQPVLLEHYPTPLAQTVFGHELHFRLLAGRLMYVPLDKLTDQLRAEARHKTWKLKQSDRITETLGPVEGFHLRYTMERQRLITRTDHGPLVQEVAQLAHFVVLPPSAELGEPIERALQAGSQFHRRLEGHEPDETVVTVWTYPDSFAEFRQLRDYLRSQGYATAGRPLPEGLPITGSPAGTRSAAE